MSEASKRMRQTYEVTGDIWFARAADEIETMEEEIVRLQREIFELVAQSHTGGCCGR